MSHNEKPKIKFNLFQPYFANQTPINQVSRQMKVTEKAIGKVYAEMREIVSIHIENLKIERQLGLSTFDARDPAALRKMGEINKSTFSPFSGLKWGTPHFSPHFG